jgi:phosphoribosylanthranilate isomerase
MRIFENRVPRFICQIYEVQSPEEAEVLAAMGVDHIGSVLMAHDAPSNRRVGETIIAARRAGVCSSLIPLFSETESVLSALAELKPDIVHFCEAPGPDPDADTPVGRLIALQREVRRHFPEIRIMRSIPIGPPGRAEGVPTLALAARFAPVSDLFLTDTLLDDTGSGAEEPVAGFVGITGQICDWDMARRLVVQSPLPVILAGGISPRNAEAGLRRVRPFGIDSCTRTNAVDGDGLPVRFQKDYRKVAQLLAAVRRAEQFLDDQGGSPLGQDA